MVRHQFLRERFVARERHAARVTPRVRDAQELQVTDDVLIECADVGEGVHQVEDDVRLELFD